MSDVMQWISGTLVIMGSLACVVGSLGLIRMPDFYTRMHAGSVTETLGVGFILLGLMVLEGWSLVTVKLAMMGVLVYFVSPTASHALAKAALHRGVKPVLAYEEKAPSKH